MSDDLGNASAQLLALGKPPELEPLRNHMIVDEYEALVSMLERRCERLRAALELISTLSNEASAPWVIISNIGEAARTALEAENE